MKKYSILILVLVLTAAVFAGCGCRNNRPMDTVPTVMPTTEATKATTEATTVPTHATEPSNHTNGTEQTDATIDNGNGPLPTDETTHAGENSRSRRVPGGY